jgi:hypothetical protein
MTIMSKGEFARHINVSKGRVSQYLASGMIGPECLIGEGRNARIDVERAVEQIRQRRDIGQALGNGLDTHLDVDGPEPTSRAGAAKPPTVDDEIKAERLERERRMNRIAAQDEAVKLGQLVPADQVRAEMTQLARQIDDENAAMLADFATAIASRFEVPQRDVLHLLRQVRSEKKAAAAERARRRAGNLPESVTTVIEDGVAA